VPQGTAAHCVPTKVDADCLNAVPATRLGTISLRRQENARLIRVLSRMRSGSSKWHSRRAQRSGRLELQVIGKELDKQRRSSREENLYACERTIDRG
jgi:hypothetical protein